jgi:transposase InsO family protein
MSKGFTHIFTIIDRSTRWVEVVPLATTSAADCAAAMVREWVARFGVPDVVTSDRGAQFTSTLWAAFCGLLGIQHHPTTAYHPQANGMIERFHRQLKNSLRARLCGANWMDHLPWVLLGLRAAPKEDSGVSTAEMLYGSPLSLPGQFLASKEPPPERFLSQLQELAAGFVPPPIRPPPIGPAVSPALLAARFVYIRRGAAASSLAPLYEGPFAVVESGVKVFRVQVGPRVEVVSVDRLKPHLGADTPNTASPPARGRPPLPPV